MPILKFENLKPKNFYKGDNFQGFSVNYIPQLNSLIVYGVLHTSDVYLFSLSKREWTLIKTGGKKPSFRKFYAHYYNDSIKGLIIHGGQIIQKNKKPKSSDECYILFIHNWHWRKIFLQENPSCRQFHQIIPNQIDLKRQELFIFGGFAKPYQTILNDLWSLTNLQNLSIKTNKHQVHGCQTKIIPTKGQAPYLYGYSSLIINNQFLFIGGQQNVQKKRLQIYILSLKSYHWQKLGIINKLCPSLMFLQVYVSAIDTQIIHIFGGMDINTNKANDKCYILNLRQMDIVQQSKSKTSLLMTKNIPSQNSIIGYSHSCCITESPLCVGLVESNSYSEQQIQIMILFEKQPSTISKHFETDQVEEQKCEQELSIQQYLKGIKHEQILSQELIKKNLILQELYKQIQRYISHLYIKYYLNLPSDCQNSQIQSQKQKNIQNCQNLKQSYTQNSMEYEDILHKIKLLRTELGEIHQDIQRCIQTQIDEEEDQ